MKSSTLLRKAAEYMGSTKAQHGACDALYMANRQTLEGDFEKAHKLFQKQFKPRNNNSMYWWGATIHNYHIYGITLEQAKENQTARVLALLFASYMAEEAGD